MIDTKKYIKYFQQLSKQWKKTMLINILNQIKNKNNVFSNIYTTLKKNKIILELYLVDTFNKLLKIVAYKAQKQQKKNIENLKNIQKKIHSVKSKEKSEQEDAEAILDYLTK